MNTLQRIKQYIDYKGISNKKFEEKIGYSNGAFASQLKNKRTIGSDKIENILNIFNELNPTWLLTGKGSMLLNNKKENIAAELAAVYKVTPPVQEKEPPQVSSLQYEIQSLKERIKDKEEIISLQKDRIEKDAFEIKELKEKITQGGVFINKLKKQLAELQEKWAELNKKLLVEKKDYRSLMDAGGSVPSKLPANKPSVIQAERNTKKQRPRK